MRKSVPLSAALILVAALSAMAAEEPAKGTFVDVKSAGPDYLVQGEYLGQAAIQNENRPMAAQVVATGSGSFYALIMQGGLPGAGWDGKAPVILKGNTDQAVTTLKGSAQPAYSATIRDGTMSLKTDKGEMFELKRTERKSPTLGAKAPAGGIVLFDGKSVDAWSGGHLALGDALAAGTKSQESYKNFTLHLEFMTPFQPAATGEGRGNSGVYLQDRYEIQVLDSFAVQKMWTGVCGAIYSQKLPDVSMCLPPLTWQTFDFEFEMAKFDEQGQKTHNAIVTLRHNGVLVHDKAEIKASTGGGKREGPSGGPFQLQGHGNPVFFRNIWVVEK